MAKIRVTALVNVMDDGKIYPAGTEFEMEENIVQAHVTAKQVVRVEPAETTKAQTTPADKQFKGGKSK